MMGKVLVFDTETTGKEKTEEKDCQIIEAAWLELNDKFDVIDKYCELFKPSIPIELGAMATHHIIEEDLQGKRDSSDFNLPDDTEYIIGHNVDFDWTMAGEPNVKRIDTLALAKKLLPGLDSYKQIALIYYFEPDHKKAREMVQGAHDALIDVGNCLYLLKHIVKVIEEKYNREIKDIEHLWRISEWARIPDTIDFGKHNGKKISELPKDYVEWLQKNCQDKVYLMKAIELNKIKQSKNDIDSVNNQKANTPSIR